MPSMNLNGRVALVTGAGRNIGRQISLALADHGCDVAVNVGSNRDEGEGVVSEIVARGRRGLVAVADVSRADEVTAMVDEITRRFGHIDILVNNAAIRPPSPFTKLTEELWDRVLGVNLNGPFYCCKAVVPMMIASKSGCIINISGSVAVNGGVDSVHIAASKAGLHGMTKALAVELGVFGIRVNTLILAGVDTVRRVPIHGVAASIEQIPLRRRGTVQEIANAAVFLCSDYASYVTGQGIHVNGGALLA